MNYTLQARLRECLQTILDFEVHLEQHSATSTFINDLSVLREFVQKVDVLTLSEEDVTKIEVVTEHFLSELTSVPSSKSLHVVQ